MPRTRLFVAVLFLFVLSSLSLPWAMADQRLPVPQASVASGFHALPDGRLFVAVEFETPPAARVYAETLSRLKGARAQVEAVARRNAVAQHRRILDEQAALLPSLLTVPGLRIDYTLSRLFNGAVVRIERDRLAALRRLPGLRAVYPVPLRKPLNAHGVPLIGAAQAWTQLGVDLTGQSVRIGVIDSGIDYLHADFGGAGSQSDYDANDPTVLGDVTFPTAKVVGGYDFAGENYNPENSSTDEPEPDPDPMDTVIGHGTHVAGTIAGTGVDAEGLSFDGPYNQSLPFDALGIGPGVAPEAQLLALKVFGSGSTTLAARAMEWAVDPNDDGDFADHLDVVNLSLGGSYGSTGDFENRVYENAVAAGVIVVAAAGNEGDTTFVSGAPSTGEGVLAVAATWHDGMAFLALRVDEPQDVAGDYIASSASFGPSLTAEGVSGQLMAAQPVDACADLGNAAALSGKVALIERGDCTFVSKIRRVQDAGAIGAVVINNEPGWAIQMGGTGSDLTIPSLMIAQDDGVLLRAAIAGDPVTVTIADNEVQRPELADSLGDFSSRGPSHNRLQPYLKPDIAAPGVSVYSAATLSGSDGYATSGTSMACPHMCGVMALLRQAHPDWTVAELKALAMNTAGHAVSLLGRDDLPPLSPTRAGAGRVDAAAALERDLIAFDAEAPSRVSLSYALLDVVEPTSETRNLRVLNKGETPVTLEAAYATAVDLPGVTVTLTDADAVTIQPGAFADWAVKVDVDPAALKRTPAPTLDTFLESSEQPRFWLAEETGLILLSPPEGEPILRVPLLAVPRPASAMSASETLLQEEASSGVATLHLEGTGVHTGENIPQDVISLLTPFEWRENSADDDPYGLPIGYDPDLADLYDLKTVGVNSNYTAVMAADGSMDEVRIAFAVVTHGVWGSPVEARFYISLDTNLDGQPDYYLMNDLYDTDVYAAWCINARSGDVEGLTYLNGYPADEAAIPAFMSDAMVLSVPADLIGLSPTNTRFYFQTETMLDTGRRHLVDLARPCLDFERDDDLRSTLEDQDGATLGVAVDREACREQLVLGALLLHHNNAFGERDETIPLAGFLCEDDADCTEAAFPVCHPTYKVCMACVVDGDCAADEICDPATNFCVPDAAEPDGDEPDGDEPDGDDPDGDEPDGDTGLVCVPGFKQCQGDWLMQCDRTGREWFVTQNCGARGCLDQACGDAAPANDVPLPQVLDDSGDGGCRQGGETAASIMLLLMSLLALCRRRKNNAAIVD